MARDIIRANSSRLLTLNRLSAHRDSAESLTAVKNFTPAAIRGQRKVGLDRSVLASRSKNTVLLRAALHALIDRESAHRVTVSGGIDPKVEVSQS